ncbi:MAG: triose-phosphate isomerase [Mycoplasmoidaceae bacterium]
MRKKLIIGNWKMNKTKKEILDFVKDFQNEIKNLNLNCDYGVAPSSIYLDFTKEAFKDNNKIIISAQDAHFEEKGAFTGANSWSQLKDIGIKYSIIGHSERREMFGDTNTVVNKKITKLLQEKIVPILCVGESLEDRESGNANNVVSKQLEMALIGIEEDKIKSLVIAYEPIWAIGTGKSATSQDAENMCCEIRTKIKCLFGEEIANKIIILYGGSVNDKNGKEYLSQENIDGALVGGASLDAKLFVSLLKVVD